MALQTGCKNVLRTKSVWKTEKAHDTVMFNYDCQGFTETKAKNVDKKSQWLNNLQGHNDVISDIVQAVLACHYTVHKGWFCIDYTHLPTL